MEKLLITFAACTAQKGKAGANGQRPTPGVADFFYQKKVPIKGLFNFFRGCLFIIPTCFLA